MDGHEALAKAAATRFDVIISDIHMPSMDGLEFCQRAIEKNPALRTNFLICSGDISFERAMFLKKNGVSYLPKPFTIPQLRLAVDRLIERKSRTT